MGRSNHVLFGVPITVLATATRRTGGGGGRHHQAHANIESVDTQNAHTGEGAIQIRFRLQVENILHQPMCWPISRNSPHVVCAVRGILSDAAGKGPTTPPLCALLPAAARLARRVRAFYAFWATDDQRRWTPTITTTPGSRRLMSISPISSPHPPQAHQDIDMGRPGDETLDKVAARPGARRRPGAALRRQIGEVRTRQGQHDLVYVHIEVQGQHDPDFAQRMFVYHYRIFDRFGQPPVSRRWPMSIVLEAKPLWLSALGMCAGVCVPHAESERTRPISGTALLASDNPFAIFYRCRLGHSPQQAQMDERRPASCA